MQKTINPTNGQSNYDICLQAIGGLDTFIKFCMNNGIQNTSQVKKTSYIFDTNDTISSNIIGYPYATQNDQNISDSVDGAYGSGYGGGYG